MNNPQSALGRYRTVGVHSGVTNASPHQLIAMLLNGAMDFIAAGKGFMERGDVAGKGEKIGRAISIVDALRAYLDRERGGVIAANLAALYDYIEQRLLIANRENRPELLEEVAALLREVKLGWDQISPLVSDTAVGQNS